MIDHLGVVVADYEKSRDFYLKALGPLGYTLVMELSRENIPHLPSPKVGGLGAKGKPDLWLSGGTPTSRTHLAFLAPNRAAVDAFYKAAVAAGGQPNGEPGLRPHYHEHYYGAFVIDINGHNLEAVCHDPA